MGRFSLSVWKTSWSVLIQPKPFPPLGPGSVLFPRIDVAYMSALKEHELLSKHH